MTIQEFIDRMHHSKEYPPYVLENDVEEAMEQYGKQESISFYHWSARNAYYIKSKERWYILPSSRVYVNLEGYTDEEIFQIYQQQNNG